MVMCPALTVVSKAIVIVESMTTAVFPLGVQAKPRMKAVLKSVMILIKTALKKQTLKRTLKLRRVVMRVKPKRKR